MSEETFDLTKRLGQRRLEQFAEYIRDLGDRFGFKISSRGWCYALETERLINKDQFSKVENAINRCRKKGLLPIDFVAEEGGRDFEGVETPSAHEGKTMDQVVVDMLNDITHGAWYYTPDWWMDETYYIQVVVEKVDLKTLFKPVCEEYHAPIATSKGWSSMLQRATYARRYAEAESRGLECVLLYCGDHDPDGLRISDTLRSNIADLCDVEWEDGFPGYDPENLIIDRFGLEQGLIDEMNLTWIDNLVTGSGKNLASSGHPNHGLDYVQDYLRNIGERKCEGNALIPFPDRAAKLMHEAFEKYLGGGAPDRFRKRRRKSNEHYAERLEASGIDLDAVQEAIDTLTPDEEE